MADAGYFRGTSSEQDNRFSDKEKKLLKQMKFADNLTTKVEMNKIKLDVLKPWISKRISELLGMEDDVVVEFVINQLEAEKSPDARKIQINLTGFLNGKNARIFTGELWGMLISAQESSVGIPASMVEAKKDEIKKRNEEQERINETLKRTVSRFNDRLKQERESPPPLSRRSRSPDSSTKDKARSRSKDRDPKSSRPSKPGDSDTKRGSPEPNSKGREDAAKEGKRNYRSRRSSSASPEPNNRRRSRSRSPIRDKRPQRDLMEEIKDQRRGGPERDRGGPERDRGGRDRRRSRSPLQRSNKRSRSRSPLRGRSRRSPSPQRGFRRRSPVHEKRFRPEYSHRDVPPRRDSSADRHRRFEERRSRSRSPNNNGRIDSEHRKPSVRLLPDGVANSAHPNNNKTAKQSPSPEPVPVRPAKKASGSSSGDESSSSEPEVQKPEKSSSKKKASGSDASSNSEEDQPAKKRKDKKKKNKKEKKHKKQKKHKKLKKSKKRSSEDEAEEDGSEEDEEGEKLTSSRIAKSYLKLVEPNQKVPSSEDLERKLREKALMSMKKASSMK